MRGLQGATSHFPRLQTPGVWRISVRLNKLIFVRNDPQGSSFVFQLGARPVIGIDAGLRHVPALTSAPGPHTFCAALFHFVPPLLQHFSLQIKISEAAVAYSPHSINDLVVLTLVRVGNGTSAMIGVGPIHDEHVRKSRHRCAQIGLWSTGPGRAEFTVRQAVHLHRRHKIQRPETSAPVDHISRALSTLAINVPGFSNSWASPCTSSTFERFSVGYHSLLNNARWLIN